MTLVLPLLMAAIAALWVMLGWNRSTEVMDFGNVDDLDLEEQD